MHDAGREQWRRLSARHRLQTDAEPRLEKARQKVLRLSGAARRAHRTSGAAQQTASIDFDACQLERRAAQLTSDRRAETGRRAAVQADTRHRQPHRHDRSRAERRFARHLTLPPEILQTSHSSSVLRRHGVENRLSNANDSTVSARAGATSTTNQSLAHTQRQNNRRVGRQSRASQTNVAKHSARIFFIFLNKIKMKVVIINCLSDNLAYLLIDEEAKVGKIETTKKVFCKIFFENNHYFSFKKPTTTTKPAYAVDPVNPIKVIEAAKKEGVV